MRDGIGDDEWEFTGINHPPNYSTTDPTMSWGLEETFI
jgi:hypothetical protein